MSFDIQYDKNGYIKPNQQLKENLNQAADAQGLIPDHAVSPQQIFQESVETTESQAITEAPQEVAASEPEVQRTGPKTPAESFRELKTRKDQLEKENEELKRLAYEKKSYQAEQPQKISEPEIEDFDLQVGDDDLLEGKHGKNIVKKLNAIAKEQARERIELQRQREQITQQSIERELKEQYPDIGKVLSDDNIAMLEYLDSKFFSGLKANPDTYSKLVSAYLRMKEKGIYKEDIFIADKKRIQDNAAKPRLSPAVSSTQPGESALSKAGMFTDGLTKELAAQLNKEMFESRRGY